MRPLRARQALATAPAYHQVNSGRTYHAYISALDGDDTLRLDTRSAIEGKVRGSESCASAWRSRSYGFTSGFYRGWALRRAATPLLGGVGGAPAVVQPVAHRGRLHGAGLLRPERLPRDGQRSSAPRDRPFPDFPALAHLPALFVEVTLSALVLGPLFTRLPLADYFSDPQFMRYFGNIVGILITFYLPGVFESGYVPVVNGNLWTLPSEFHCYLITAALMISGLAYNRTFLTAVMAAVTVVLIGLNTFSYFRSGNY